MWKKTGSLSPVFFVELNAGNNFTYDLKNLMSYADFSKVKVLPFVKNINLNYEIREMNINPSVSNDGILKISPTATYLTPLPESEGQFMLAENFVYTGSSGNIYYYTVTMPAEFSGYIDFFNMIGFTPGSELFMYRCFINGIEYKVDISGGSSLFLGFEYLNFVYSGDTTKSNTLEIQFHRISGDPSAYTHLDIFVSGCKTYDTIVNISNNIILNCMVVFEE